MFFALLLKYFREEEEESVIKRSKVENLASKTAWLYLSRFFNNGHRQRLNYLFHYNFL